MKKDEFFRNCPKIENNKIHITDVAQTQHAKEINGHDLLIADCGLGSFGSDSLENILTSLNALEKQPFNKIKLDELYLLETEHIRSKTRNLISIFGVLRNKICDDTDTLVHLSRLLTDALLLGNKIGTYNENIENLQALRDNEKLKKSQSTGGDNSNKNSRNIKKLVVGIVQKMKLDKRINSSPLPDKALAIQNLLQLHRQEKLVTSTIQDYLSEASGEKSKGGRPPKGKPSQEELLSWLQKNFTADDVNNYFLDEEKKEK